MQIFRFNRNYQSFLYTCLSMFVLLTSSACSKQVPIDKDGNPYSAESIHALIDDLGKFDLKAGNSPRVTVQTDKRRAAFQTLSELGSNAMPLIIERLRQLPELEQAAMQQSDTENSKLKLRLLLARKADLISLVSASGNKEHGQLLLSMADTNIGTGKVRTASLVLALRAIGATTEEQIMLDRLFKSPELYESGSGTLLESLSTMRRDSDKALAARVAAWPLESRIKGRAILLAARLGLKEPTLSEIKDVLKRTEMPSEIRYPDYELGLHLTALAELLPVDEYRTLTASAKLFEHSLFRSVIQAAQQRNEFWWAGAEQKDRLVLNLIRTQLCNNDILALHYMLKNKRLDLMLKAHVLRDRSALKRHSEPEIKPYYEIGEVGQHRIQPAGYKLSAVDGKVLIDKIPGYGMFD